MRLFEAVIDANHRAAAGDTSAGLRPTEFADSLPIIALTCIDPRLNPLIPEVLGIPEEQFIWLRNAGNVITSPLSSTMRSLALACAIKGGKEIVILGHSDCQVCKTTTLHLLERLQKLGIDRRLLPDNINEYFGLFASERQNVMKAADLVRNSPLIGPNIPVHGVLVDISSGRLEWLVNGYQQPLSAAGKWNEVVKSAGQTLDALKDLTDLKIGEWKFPETKIGEVVTQGEDWLAKQVRRLEIGQESKPAEPPPAVAPPAPPPKIPLPPPLKPRLTFRKKSK
jgi:carbonic anhydrase